MGGGIRKVLVLATVVSSVSTMAAAQNTASAPTSATGKVLQPIVVSKVRDLSLGTVTRPLSGGSTVTIDATSGARSIAGGNGSLVTGGSPGRAEFYITGEGGQAYQITAPASLTLTRSGGAESLTVNLTTTAKTGALTGAIGTTANTTFGVGGSLTLYPQTISGDYQGTFEITVAYN